MIRKLFYALLKPLAGLDCEDAIGHSLEDVGGGVAEQAFGERVDGNAFFSWS